jgi:hypothetical protein
VTFYYDGSAVVIQDSYNIQGVLYVGVGDYRIDFATGVMPDANYTVATQGSDSGGAFVVMNLRLPAEQTTTNYRLITGISGGAQADLGINTVTFFGNQ